MLALAEPRGPRPLIAHCHLGLGRLYGPPPHLATAVAMFRDMDMSFWLGQAQSESNRDNGRG